MVPATILIVDDEPDVRDVAATWLEHSGYTVATAASGAEALAWTAAHQADVLVLDVRMRPMMGVELLEALVARGGRVPPVVLTTAYLPVGETEDVAAAVRRLAGRAEVLTKPYDLHALEAAIAGLVATGGDAPVAPATAPAVVPALLEALQAEAPTIEAAVREIVRSELDLREGEP